MSTHWCIASWDLTYFFLVIKQPPIHPSVPLRDRVRWGAWARPPAAGAEVFQTVLAHIHCVSVSTKSPSGSFVPADRSLGWIPAYSTPTCSSSRAPQELLLPKKSQWSVLGGFVIPRRAHRPVLTPGYGLAAPMGLQSSLAKRWALPDVDFAMFRLCCFSTGFLHQSTHLHTVHDGKKNSIHWVEVCYFLK